MPGCLLFSSLACCSVCLFEYLWCVCVCACVFVCVLVTVENNPTRIKRRSPFQTTCVYWNPTTNKAAYLLYCGRCPFGRCTPLVVCRPLSPREPRTTSLSGSSLAPPDKSWRVGPSLRLLLRRTACFCRGRTLHRGGARRCL